MKNLIFVLVIIVFSIFITSCGEQGEIVGVATIPGKAELQCVPGSERIIVSINTSSRSNLKVKIKGQELIEKILFLRAFYPGKDIYINDCVIFPDGSFIGRAPFLGN